MFSARLAALTAALLLTAAACSNDQKSTPVTTAEAARSPLAAGPAVAAPPPAAAALPAAAPAAPVGFDLAAVPVASPKLGAFPFFSLLEGYEPLTVKNGAGNSAREHTRDVAFDEYDFFDGTRLQHVEGRLFTTMALGKGSSFFQAKKTYEKLVRDLGGVTVWEGKGQAMKDLKLSFPDRRHRGRYVPEESQFGVYLLRTPDREVWVEVNKNWTSNDDSYWLTIVERKALPVQASVLPAAELKKALDAAGRVALYLNFDTDQATLKPDAQASIAQIIALLSQSPDLRLGVEGHTDNAGTPAHNQTLSEARARTVVATLTAQGIAPDRLTPAGFGQTKPLADNATEAGRAQNRRVELVKR